MRPRLFTDELEARLQLRVAASADDVLQLKEAVANCLGEVEERLSKLTVPVVRGRFLGGESAQIVDVASLDWALLEQILVPGSLCVLDLQPLLPAVSNDTEARNLHVCLRQGTSGTWIRLSIVLAGGRDVDTLDELADEEEDFEPELPELGESELRRLAVKVAQGEGFGSLKTKAERQDLARHLLADEADPLEEGYFLWKITDLAESYYRTGIAPMRAKQLQSEGKCVAEIARELGLSRQRVQAALVTKTPLHVATLLGQ